LAGVAVACAAVALVVARWNTGNHHAVASVPGVTAPHNYAPRYAAVQCPADVRQSAAGVTCGTLTIPQDRRAPRAKQVTLLVTRAPPRLAGHTIAPTIDICGCENVANSLARDHSELIHIGQRGYDGTPVLLCPEFVSARRFALALPSNDRDASVRTVAALRDCHARLLREGVDPAQYNFDTAAQDVVDLMSALKITHANLVASGVVSAEAFDVLRRVPGAIRSLTLDNPTPPGLTLISNPIGDLSGAFERFANVCNSDLTCKGAYPDLQRAWRDAYAAANRKPAVETVADPFTPNGPSLKILLDGPRTADALAAALRDASTYQAIPTAITQSASGTVEASLVAQEDRLVSDAPWAAQASYYCSYEVHTQDPDAEALAAHTLAHYVRAHDADWSQWCAAWPVPDASETLSTEIVSDVPTLIFRGDLTPDGSPDWIAKIERSLTHVQTVVFPTLGGDLLADGPPCLSALRRRFLSDPTAKLDTTSCARQSPPIHFVAPSG
jgi:pimeloyl-ACP methyl ester carboxylesterase